jgi:hypothetical protein
MAPADVPSDSLEAGGEAEDGFRHEIRAMETAQVDAIVSEVEDTRVEIRVRADGLEVLLDTVEVQAFDGVEDELRDALRQSDMDLLQYEARERETSTSQDRPRRRRPGPRNDSVDESGDEGRSSERVARGSIIDVLA